MPTLLDCNQLTRSKCFDVDSSFSHPPFEFPTPELLVLTSISRTLMGRLLGCIWTPKG